MSLKSATFISPFIYPLFTDKHAGNCGGAERQLFLFGRYLADAGWRVSFITSRPPFEIDIPKAFTVYFADFSYLGGSKLRLPKDWLTLWSAMDRADSYFYVLKVPVHLLAPMSIFTRMKRRRLVFWSQISHDSNPQERAGLNRFAVILQDWGVKRADLVIAQNEEQRKNFATYYGIDAVTVPSIAEWITPLTASGLADKKVDVLWVGNSSAKKRQEVFFELSRLLPHRTFAMAMNRSDVLRYEQAQQASKALANVSFLGTLAPIEMEKWFARTRLFLNTSTMEGCPNTFLQSWLNGVPVVSLNIDPDGCIERFGLGRVAGQGAAEVCKGDFRAMAGLLAPLVEQLLDNAALLREADERAGQFVEDRHSPSVVGPRLIAALEESEN